MHCHVQLCQLGRCGEHTIVYSPTCLDWHVAARHTVTLEALFQVIRSHLQLCFRCDRVTGGYRVTGRYRQQVRLGELQAHITTALYHKIEGHSAQCSMLQLQNHCGQEHAKGSTALEVSWA